MTTITPTQAINRLRTLPQELVDAIFDESSADVIEEIGERHHIPEDRQREIAKISGWVLLGFLHPGDVAREIQEHVAINQQVAQDVAGQLNKKLFAEHKELLGRVYAPLGKTAPGTTRPDAEEAPAPEKSKQADKQRPGQTEASSPKGKAMADIEKQAPPTRIPTEKSEESRELPKPISVTPPEASPPTKPKTPPAPKEPSIEQSDTARSAQATKPAPAPKPSSNSAAPFMLSEESKPRPRSQKSDFKLKIDKELFQENKKEAPAPPARSARLEIGKQKPEQKGPRIARTQPEKPRVVHYSDRKTSLRPDETTAQTPSVQSPAPNKQPKPPAPTAQTPTPPNPPQPINQESEKPKEVPTPTPSPPTQTKKQPEPKKDGEQENKNDTISLSDLG